MTFGNTDEEKSSASRVDFHYLIMRTAVSPKRTTGNRHMRGPLGLSLARSRSFREEQKKDLSLSEGVRLTERFQSIERTIYGIGFTCVVVMGINRDTKEKVAIKVIMKSKLHTRSELDRAQFELKIHSNLSHRHILPLLEGEETLESIIIVTPLACGDLYSVTTNKVLSEVNCQRLCKQLLLALDYLHTEAGIVHFDIKPQNILLFESSNGYIAKICDFGFSECLKFGESLPYAEMRGSLGYFSPEQLRHDPLSHAVDMFALGVIIYQLLCGYEPFYPTNKVRYLNGDWEGNDSKLLSFDSPYWDHISKEAKDFVVNLLNGDPKKRMTAQSALSSSWIRLNPEQDQNGHRLEDINVPFATQ